MGMEFLPQTDIYFDAVQQREKEKYDTGDTDKRRYIPKPNFHHNQIRGRIFGDSARKLRPDASVLAEYENFLAKNYVIALQKQLNKRGGTQRNKVRVRYSNLGYAKGSLQKEIKAKSKLDVRHSTRKGRVLIKYELTPEYNEYGNYIAGGRRAAYIKIQPLIKWINQKIALGSFRILRAKKGSGLDNREKIIKSIAFAISYKAGQQSKPPVLKDWSSWSENKNLRQMFKSLTASKGAYLRRKIRNNIVNKLKVKYGD